MVNELYTLAEIAKLLRVSYKTVKRAKDTGALKVLKVSPGRYRVTRSQLEEYLRLSK